MYKRQYLIYTLLNPNVPPYAGTLGLLDAGGEATATLTVPPGSPPALAGLAIHHAFLVFAASGEVVLASQPASLALIP